jgi:hypothetical protein
MSKKEQMEMYKSIHSNLNVGLNWKSAGWGDNWFYAKWFEGKIILFAFMETCDYVTYSNTETGIKKFVRDIIENQKSGL